MIDFIFNKRFKIHGDAMHIPFVLLWMQCEKIFATCLYLTKKWEQSVLNKFNEMFHSIKICVLRNETINAETPMLLSKIQELISVYTHLRSSLLLLNSWRGGGGGERIEKNKDHGIASNFRPWPFASMKPTESWWPLSSKCHRINRKLKKMLLLELNQLML